MIKYVKLVSRQATSISLKSRRNRETAATATIVIRIQSYVKHITSFNVDVNVSMLHEHQKVS